MPRNLQVLSLATRTRRLAMAMANCPCFAFFAVFMQALLLSGSSGAALNPVSRNLEMVDVVVDMLTAQQSVSRVVLLKQDDVQNIDTMLSMCLDALVEASLKAAQAVVHILYLSCLRFAACSSCGQTQLCSTIVEEEGNYGGRSKISSVIVSHKVLVSFDSENIVIFTAQSSGSLAYCCRYSTAASVEKLVLQPPNEYSLGGKSNMEEEKQSMQYRWNGVEHCLSPKQKGTVVNPPEEYNPETCRISGDNELLQGPDTDVRLNSTEINSWVVAAKNKDEEDDDEEDDDDDEGDDDDEDDDDDDGEEGAAEDEEGVDGVQGGEGDDEEEGDDDDDEDEEDGEEGKEDVEGDEDDDGVEGEEEEDGEGDEDDDEVDGAGDEEDDEDDKDDETSEPPKKKRK